MKPVSRSRSKCRLGRHFSSVTLIPVEDLRGGSCIPTTARARPVQDADRTFLKEAKVRLNLKETDLAV